jgi:phosphoribosyl 1,2-cyclic phosphodiesterase
MVEVGKYPYPLKRRVLGNKGHLSNELSGRLLCQILHSNLKHICLGHLSKDNNFPELAYETVKLEVTMGNTPFRGDEIPLEVLARDEMSKIMHL